MAFFFSSFLELSFAPSSSAASLALLGEGPKLTYPGCSLQSSSPC